MPKQFFGKEMEDMARGRESVHVPNYVSHTKKGLYRSTKVANSQNFSFSREERF